MPNLQRVGKAGMPKDATACSESPHAARICVGHALALCLLAEHRTWLEGLKGNKGFGAVWGGTEGVLMVCT